jgi:hypothetical protein
MPYAHAVIVDPRTDFRYERGHPVPDDLPGIEELREFGSVKDEPYEAPRADRMRWCSPRSRSTSSPPRPARRSRSSGLTTRHVNGADGATSTESA